MAIFKNDTKMEQSTSTHHKSGTSPQAMTTNKWYGLWTCSNNLKCQTMRVTIIRFNKTL